MHIIGNANERSGEKSSYIVEHNVFFLSSVSWLAAFQTLSK